MISSLNLKIRSLSACVSVCLCLCAVHSKMRIFNVRAENVQKYPKNAELRIIDGNQLKPNRTRDDVGDKLGQYDRQQDCSESANRAF